MQSDMDIIITVNPDLAEQVHDASWIMVDTTFPVVHGTMNEWKLLIWLNGLDKSTVIGRVWSNRATREAFVIVWNGIFEAIKLITGKSRNFKVFSKSSSLLGAIGDSEGAQAQGLGDVIILRQMNTYEVNGMPTITVDGILPVIWKTCLVHFKRGVFKLEAYVEEYIFHSLLGFFLTSKLWRKLKIIAISARIQQTPNILAGLGPQEIEAQALPGRAQAPAFRPSRALQNTTWILQDPDRGTHNFDQMVQNFGQTHFSWKNSGKIGFRRILGC
ncbi:hypothetical protein B0H14DRAFT_3549905 [Mycena olivaceomarginata]|nr:hypothetical protein B0H14DRAFT_3549905 [Mycena olivaceomarginata]